MYCPPEHVDAEVDSLLSIYNQLVEEKVHPIIIAAWFHHAFTTIHPFQDGNGRDVGESLDQIADILTKKIKAQQQKKQVKNRKALEENRMLVFDICLNYLNQEQALLSNKLGKEVYITLKSCSPTNDEKQHFYFGQIVSYAKQHGYYFNHSLPKAWITFRIQLSKEKIYQLGITIHHYGYGGVTLAIGAFLEFLGEEDHIEERIEASIPLDLKPYVISIYKDIQAKEKNIKSFLNNALTLTLAQIASEL